MTKVTFRWFVADFVADFAAAKVKLYVVVVLLVAMKIFSSFKSTLCSYWQRQREKRDQ